MIRRIYAYDNALILCGWPGPCHRDLTFHAYNSGFRWHMILGPLKVITLLFSISNCPVHYIDIRDALWHSLDVWMQRLFSVHFTFSCFTFWDFATSRCPCPKCKLLWVFGEQKYLRVMRKIHISHNIIVLLHLSCTLNDSISLFIVTLFYETWQTCFSNHSNVTQESQ